MENCHEELLTMELNSKKHLDIPLSEEKKPSKINGISEAARSSSGIESESGFKYATGERHL